MNDIPRCSLCSRESVIYTRYNGNNLCKMHFIESVKKRVSSNLREQASFKKNDVIAVAVSGGKDSMSMLKLLKDTLPPIPGLRLVAITVNEGIEGYRNHSIPLVKRVSESMGIEFRTIAFDQINGLPMDVIATKDRVHTPCSYCGVWRRKGMNILAKEVGADYLAVGMNLDDITQSILMNFTKANMDQMARLGPHIRKQSDLVPRILPLVTIPEKEVFLYAILTGIEFHHATCPYSDRAMRNTYREIISMLEDSMPGTKYSILKAHRTLLPLLYEKYPVVHLNYCLRCGEPSVGSLCHACELYDQAITVKDQNI